MHDLHGFGHHLVREHGHQLGVLGVFASIGGWLSSVLMPTFSIIGILASIYFQYLNYRLKAREVEGKGQ